MKISIPYKLRCALALGAIAGGALVACNKGNTTPDTPTRDVELVFNAYNTKNLKIDTVKKYANMPDVRYVYMLTQGLGGWDAYFSDDISSLRNFLQQRIDINPKKVHGKGSFNFEPGMASKPDSLWYVQNGWAIKQK
ncbi:MAG: hypothetical protein MJY44_03235 [Bacteroidales bacterium]|nr:hypothetical protein [Bacteroidales bacterium]